LLRRLKSSPYDSPSRVRSIREFAAFHHRLNHSHQRLLLSPNSLLLSLPSPSCPPLPPLGPHLIPPTQSILFGSSEPNRCFRTCGAGSGCAARQQGRAEEVGR
ncbi:unnamed protein product, partial [Closterium sp. NIES-65]